VGKDSRLTKKTKICSLLAKRTQLEFNVFNGSRVYVKDFVVPSKCKWCSESPTKKRKPPAVRPPLQAGKTKKVAAKQSSSSYISSESVDTNEATNAMEYQETVTEEQRQGTQVSTENGLPKELERKLLILEKELRETKAQITTLEKENDILVEKL